MRKRIIDPGLAIRRVLAYAPVADAEFPSGAGFSVPTQIVFVPMLLLLPTPVVPLLVAVALVLTSTVSACDPYNAMTTDRSYLKALTAGGRR